MRIGVETFFAACHETKRGGLLLMRSHATRPMPEATENQCGCAAAHGIPIRTAAAARGRRTRMKKIAIAMASVLLYSLTFVAHSQGLYIKLNAPAEPEVFTELQQHIPFLKGVPIESVRVHDLRGVLMLIRIEDNKHCFRETCINIVARKQNSTYVYTVAASSDTVFISDEGAQISGRLGFVVNLLTDVSGIGIKIFVSDDAIVVLP